jgi:sec-independent protein translocase protein TatC
VRAGRRGKPAPVADDRMSLRDHLAELRGRLLWSLGAVTVGTVAGYLLSDRVIGLLETPYCSLPATMRDNTGGTCTLAFFHPLDAFSLQLNLSLIVGLIISSPIWLYQLWAFIAPGLRSTEKRWGVAFVVSSIALFAAGAYVAFLILHPALQFLLGALSQHVRPVVGAQEYLGFMGTLLLIFGASFEFPLLLVLLNASGILPFRRMLHFWRGTVMGVFVFAAVATPTQDPFSMLALAVPMCGLYAGALAFAWVHDRRKARRQAEDPLASLSPDEASPLPRA